jgi:hypothetical protein
MAINVLGVRGGGGPRRQIRQNASSGREPKEKAAAIYCMLGLAAPASPVRKCSCAQPLEGR